MTPQHTEIPHNTTAKLIGLAATGAAMLGMNLSDALLLDPQELSALIRSMHGAGHTAPAHPIPAAVLPTQHPAATTPAPEPEATTPLPTGMGLTARVAWLEGQRTNTNNH